MDEDDVGGTGIGETALPKTATSHEIMEARCVLLRVRYTSYADDAMNLPHPKQ